ncbi:MAG: hypothetical protein RLZZ596_1406 [Pseudomonadota bacterium]|jgi:indolepyruvate ferredoxin oxidoreductase beta subunit
MTQQPISLLLCALGGEGGGVLTEWLVEAARLAGYPVQATSIPGVAQRTGATTYYLEVFPVPLSELGQQRPVLGLYPVPGRLDGLVSSELLETVRQISLGHASAERTLVLSSSARALTTHEKMQLADGRRDEQQLMQMIASQSQVHHVLDMAELTRQAGTVVSAVMLGCIAASGLLPMAREAYRTILADGSSAAQASLRGFDLGFTAIEQQRVQARYLDGVLRPEPQLAEPPVFPAPFAPLFPPELHALIALGYERLVDYQSPLYAKQYMERLYEVHRAERESDPRLEHGWAITREMARWLALWMAFDDIVRVADLKSRASRMQRVRGEVKAGSSDLLKLYDHFKPGVPEFAALLPGLLARPLLAWDNRRKAKGKRALALPLKIGAHTITGMLALRGLAALKALRPKGSRFATEQALIDEWLTAVIRLTNLHWQSGHEVAQCGRLVKGYGSTNERGKENLLHVVRHLSVALHFTDHAQRAQAIAAARQAALADDSGKTLDHTLQQLGVPARPIKEQPIRWVRRKAAAREIA